jgi:hypothetical protein
MPNVKDQFFLSTADGSSDFVEVRPIEGFSDEYRETMAFVEAVRDMPAEETGIGHYAIDRYDRYRLENMDASTAFQLVADPDLLEVTEENWPQIAEIILQDPPFKSFLGNEPDLQELTNKGVDALRNSNHGHYVDNLVQNSWPAIRQAMAESGQGEYDGFQTPERSWVATDFALKPENAVAQTADWRPTVAVPV